MAEIHLTHKRQHGINSVADHVVSGLTAGDVLTATGANSFGWAAPTGGSGGGANAALSNLAEVAVNTALAPGTDDDADLGSAATRWKDAYLAGTVAAGAVAVGAVSADTVTADTVTAEAVAAGTVTAGAATCQTLCFSAVVDNGNTL